jgi:hypothetical protein
MSNCYRFDKLELKEKPIFKSIDATYIIYLEGNGRLQSILNQLSNIIPSKNVYIVYNKGYKKCKKADFINKPALDIVDTNLNIFLHSNEKNYKNILILEDDFIFENVDRVDVEKIDNFMIKNKDKNISYLLGAIPFILIPTFNLDHYIGLLTGGMHSVIYTRKYRNSILKLNQKEIKDWDMKDFFKLNKYIYKKSLCYQTFPLTDNRKQWFNSNIFNFIINLCLKITKLDTQIHPGYDIMYVFSKLILIILFIIIFIVIIKLRNHK